MSITLILGASNNPSRFSNRAQHKLAQFGHPLLLVNPKGGIIEGVECLESLAEVNDPIETVTVYINPRFIMDEVQAIIDLKPKRVIFNPGSESTTAQQVLEESGIEVIQACTLIMLDSGSY